MCDEQIKKAQTDLHRLEAEWRIFYIKNQYYKSHLHITASYTNNIPPPLKGMKLRHIQTTVVAPWLLKKDRDMMLYEDDRSLLSGLYTTAMIKQRDYERYFILASR